MLFVAPSAPMTVPKTPAPQFELETIAPTGKEADPALINAPFSEGLVANISNSLKL
jgi:hypothetical protein